MSHAAPRYKRAHEVLFGQSMEVSERFNSEQGICLLTKIFEVYQDVHAVVATCCFSLLRFLVAQLHGVFWCATRTGHAAPSSGTKRMGKRQPSRDILLIKEKQARLCVATSKEYLNPASYSPSGESRG